MNAFLSSSKALLEKVVFRNNSQIVHLILGNSSCDLDSFASAVVLAWGRSMQMTTTVFVPVMNIKRGEFRLRTETNFLLKKLNIDANHLLFLDDIKFENLIQAGKEYFRLTLVDHHVLAKCDEKLSKYVNEIVDHRRLVREIPSHVKINISAVGSCCTLVAEELLTSLDSSLIPEEIKTLIIGTILVDTSNFSEKVGKVTHRDIEVVKRLKGNKSENDIHELYQMILNAKFSIEGLTTEDMLLKDPKIVENSSHRILFSTLHQPIAEFFKRPDVDSVVPSYRKRANLLAWVALFPVSQTQDDDSHKPIAVYSDAVDIREKIVERLVLQDDLKIKKIQDVPLFEGLQCLRMYNTQRTRKQVLPVVDELLQLKLVP